MTPVTCETLTKRFGNVLAVDAVDLRIESGELFFLLGPSGCGKTTLLRMIAGFTDPSAGRIRFGERDVTHAQANQRNTGMVFQGYALWPHMTVEANVAFGLDVRKVPARQKQQRIEQALQTVQMTAYATRRPNELSGGQQQRVALARALVVEPTVLLLDEPLSNLDAKLRLEMRSQIRSICKAAGITAIYVTHDQKEALSMADRIALLEAGKVVQIDRPRDLYERPANRFVADFLGETNFLAAEVKQRRGNEVILETAAGLLRSTVFPEDLPPTGNVTCSIRPEAIQPVINAEAPGQSNNHFPARCIDTLYLGEMAQHQFQVGKQLQLKAFELNPRLRGGEAGEIQLTIHPRDVVILKD